MLNLAKAKPSSLPSFTKQTTIKKISYERENFSLAYQLTSPRAQTATQTTSTKIAACQRHLRSCTRSWKGHAKEAQKSTPRYPLSHHQVLMLMIRLRMPKVFLHYARRLVAPSCSRADD